MEENMYRFGVDADIGSATEKLRRVIELMDTIDGLNKKSRNNYFQSTQKDIDTNVKSMQEMIKLSKELDRQLGSIKSSRASQGDFLGVDAINAQIKALQRNLDQTKNKFQQTADSRASMSGIDRNIVKDQERFNMELKDEVKYLKDIKALRRDLSATERRVKSRASNYSSAGRLTHNQAEVLRGDMNTLSTASSMRGDNELKIDELNKQINIIDQEMAQLAKNTSMNNNERTNETASLKAMRKTLQDTVKEFQEFNSFLGGLGETVSQTQNKMSDAKVDPNQKSWKGQVASRAPSIAMASIGAFMAVVGGLYAKGATANASMREPSVSIGQRTGNSDFRAVRKQAQEMGLEKGLNYKGLDMLGFEESVMGSMGYKGAEALSDSTRAMAEGARAVPVAREQLDQFMEGAMRDGSVNNAEQIRGMQEAFLGAIEQSGMVGRETEQLEALESLNRSMFSGRNGNKQELDTVVALQSLLSEKGGNSLQGEKGGQVLTSLDQGLRGSVSNNVAKLMFGKGTKYQGREGNFLLEEQLEKGIGDTENIQTLFKSAEIRAGGAGASDLAKMDLFKVQAREVFGADLTADNVRGLYEATNGGTDLSAEAMEKSREIIESSGKEKFEDNADAYTNSHEGTADRSEAVSEKQASYLNDMGDLFRKVNSAMGGLPSLLYAFAGGLVASIGAMATSASMAGISTILKNGAGKLFGGGATATATTGTGLLKSMGSAFKGGGGFMGGLKGAGNVLKDATLFKGSEIAGKAGGLFQAGKATLGNLFGSGAGTAGAEAVASGTKGAGMLGKAGGFLGKAGGVLGKIAPWLAVGSAVVDVATSDDKVKATGKNVGMLGGMAGGASIGATIGSVVPGVGTAIGGAVGGIAGGFLGSKAGEGLINAGRGIIDWGKSFFGGDVAEASEIQQSGLSAGADKGSENSRVENQAHSEEEKDVNNKKLQSEKTREVNIMAESANLSYYDTLLSRVAQLLAQAKAQNGMFGTVNGGGSSSSGSTSGSGNLDYLGDGQKWTNEDITKHDLGKTVMGITAQELDDWIDSVAPEGSAMRGMGADYLEAGKQSGLDPRYLVAHSAVETGWGTSALSKNGDKNSGNWFGIGAFDSNPDNGFNYGDGLIGGAKWIADNFYSAGQTTLESMRHNGGQHEYATDPNWDKTIASIMKGSESFTKGQAQTFSTQNTVNVNVTDTGSSSGARAIATRIGETVQEELNSAVTFYSKELKRV